MLLVLLVADPRMEAVAYMPEWYHCKSVVVSDICIQAHRMVTYTIEPLTSQNHLSAASPNGKKENAHSENSKYDATKISSVLDDKAKGRI